MAGTDLYSILGVPKTASADEIKRAYRKLARQYHPDRNPGDSAAEERFKEISGAFAVLGDEEKRRNFDEFGPDGLREGFDPQAARNYRTWAEQAGGGRGGFGGFNLGDLGGLGGFGDLDDLLGGLFGGRRARPRPQPQRGADREREVTISLRQAVEGCDIHLPEHGGRLRIPSGIVDGQKMRMRGKGATGSGGAGDLYILVRIAAPPGFSQDGDDLQVDLPLMVSQAVVGATVEVPTPEGTIAKMRVAAGTQSGQRLRLRGKGMPSKGGERGDLYVRIMVRVPEGDSPALRAAATALDAFYQ